MGFWAWVLGFRHGRRIQCRPLGEAVLKILVVEDEKKLGQRYIGGNDTISVIASFSPRGFNEVQFIFQGISSLSELTPKLIDNFASNLVKTLNGYKELGVGAFN